MVTRQVVKAFDAARRLAGVMRDHPEQVLFEATDPPGLPDEQVAFLKEALASLHNPAQKPSVFTAADKALIRKVHGYMAPLQLLGILNERLICDQGGSAVLYTIDQLKAEIASVTTAVPSSGNDWGTLRKLLAKARREGVLDQINEQVINDFAVVYSLNQKQVMTLKDILLNGEDE